LFWQRSMGTFEEYLAELICGFEEYLAELILRI